MVLSADRATIARSPFEDCVAAVLEDIRIAVDSLPDLYAEAPAADPDKADKDAVYGPNFRNRICGRAAMMIRARVLLLAASPAFNPTDDQAKWAAAADAAAEVIDAFGGLAALQASRLEYYLNDANADYLWRKDVTNSRNWEDNNFPPSVNGRGYTNPSQNLVDAFPALNGWPISEPSAGYDASSPYDNRDPRLAIYVIRNGAAFKGATINTIDGQYDGVGKIAGRSTRSGYYMLKFMNPAVSIVEGAVVNQRHAVCLMRYTEAYLIYAEAANRAWGPDGTGSHAYSARDVVARLRSTAGITGGDACLAAQSSKEDFERLVRNERRLEMCFESVRFWDIRRWNDLTAMKADVHGTATGGTSQAVVEQRPFADHMIYGPIPDGEVRKGLEQNRGW
jgi:hypothetical protein